MPHIRRLNAPFEAARCLSTGHHGPVVSRLPTTMTGWAKAGRRPSKAQRGRELAIAASHFAVLNGLKECRRTIKIRRRDSRAERPKTAVKGCHVGESHSDKLLNYFNAVSRNFVCISTKRVDHFEVTDPCPRTNTDDLWQLREAVTQPFFFARLRRLLRLSWLNELSQRFAVIIHPATRLCSPNIADMRVNVVAARTRVQRAHWRRLGFRGIADARQCKAKCKTKEEKKTLTEQSSYSLVTPFEGEGGEHCHCYAAT